MHAICGDSRVNRRLGELAQGFSDQQLSALTARAGAAVWPPEA
jgi:hypothetical protein